METLREAQLERNATPTATPLNVCITNAGSEVAYQLASLVARGGVFEVDTPISLRLLASADRLEELEGTVMELADLASPSLAAASCTSSAQEAFSSACVVFVLDYPYEGVGRKWAGLPVLQKKARVEMRNWVLKHRRVPQLEIILKEKRKCLAVGILAGQTRLPPVNHRLPQGVRGGAGRRGEERGTAAPGEQREWRGWGNSGGRWGHGNRGDGSGREIPAPY